MRVPAFMVRQFTVPGSLRNEPGGGFVIQARNGLADGLLVGIGRISVDGVAIDPAIITATRAGEETVYRATQVSRHAPVAFRKGDVVTFRIAGLTLREGAHQLEVELIERDLGAVSLGFTETLAGGW